jgi:hypothetical protein
MENSNPITLGATFAWIIAAHPENPGNSSPRWQRGFLPLLWLIPYLVYALLFLVAAGVLGF